MKLSRHALAAALARRTLPPESPADPNAAAVFGREIAAYLLAERRSGELDSLVRDIMQYRSDAGIVEVMAVSAFPLSQSVLADIREEVQAEFPRAEHIIISRRRDPAVVGGVRLEFANQQLDLSIKHKLNRLKQGSSRQQSQRKER